MSGDFLGLGNLGDFVGHDFADMWHQSYDRPFDRILGKNTGLETGMWNGITGDHNKPIISDFGGPTSAAFSKAGDRGLDTSSSHAVFDTADSLAGILGAMYGGSALGGGSAAGGAAEGGIGGGGMTAGDFGGDYAAGSGMSSGIGGGDAGAGDFGGNYPAAQDPFAVDGAQAGPTVNGDVKGGFNWQKLAQQAARNKGGMFGGGQPKSIQMVHHNDPYGLQESGLPANSWNLIPDTPDAKRQKIIESLMGNK